MHNTPTTEAQLIAEDTWLIPNIAPSGPDTYIPANSMLIRGEQPIIVDTGAPVHRDHWREMVFSLVDPLDVRWIFLSHDDGDHTGSLHDALDLCPNAVLIANFFIVERLALEVPALPLERMRWMEPGDTVDAGDRTLQLFRPPIFDGPTTRGLFDTATGAMWIVDTFAALTTGAVHHVADLPEELVAETMPLFNSMVSPWHEWVDPLVYRAHVDRIEGLGATTIASAHGPVLTGEHIHHAFDTVRALAGTPNLVGPGQETLDDILAAALTA